MVKTCLNCGVEFDGSAQARFHSEACRKAYGRRSVEEVVPVLALDAEQAERDRWGYSPSETRTKVERDAAAQRMLGRESMLPSEEVYVKQCVELARLHHAQTSPDARDSTVNLETRLAQAEAYAHWRYRGFMAGEIESL
jgi:hypothetical protein